MKKIIIMLFVYAISNLYSTIINIPADQPTIQEGINIAVSGDTILVQSGTYIENINYNGKNITVASLFLTTQDTSYILQTIIDGNQNGRVVTFESGETSNAVLCGFTITNGIGGISIWPPIGSDPVNPTLCDLIITNNNAQYAGGGIRIRNSHPTLTNSIISNNTAGSGGGIYADGSNMTITNVQFINNILNAFPGEGGAVNIEWCIPTFNRCLFKNNQAYFCGEAIYSYLSRFTVVNCIFENNLENNNQVIFAMLHSRPTFINCTFYEPEDSEGKIAQCYNGVHLTYVNSILAAPEEVTLSITSGIVTSYLNIVNSNFLNESQLYIGPDVELTYYGTCLSEDPIFRDPNTSSFHLQDTSPCIGVGTDEIEIMYITYTAPEVDYEESLRPNPVGSMPDMGAYENALGEPQVGFSNNQIPNTQYLLTSYPNPFNPTTTISFSIPEESKVGLSIYNIKGQKIKSLLIDQISAGEHSIIWNGEDASGKKVTSGIYLYKLNVNGNTEAVNKCLLLK